MEAREGGRLQAVTSGSSVTSGQCLTDSVKTRINYHEPGGGTAGVVGVQRRELRVQWIPRKDAKATW